MVEYQNIIRHVSKYTWQSCAQSLSWYFPIALCISHINFDPHVLGTPHCSLCISHIGPRSRTAFAAAAHDDAAMAPAFADWSAALGACASHGLVGVVPVLVRLLAAVVEVAPLDSAERVAAVTGTNWTCFVDALSALEHAGKEKPSADQIMDQSTNHSDEQSASGGQAQLSVIAIQAWANSLLRSSGAARAWNSIALFERKRRLAAQLGASSPTSSSAQQPSEADMLLHAQPPPALDAPSPADAVVILIALTRQCDGAEATEAAALRDSLLEWAAARAISVDCVAALGNATGGAIASDAARAVCANAWARLQARNPLFGNQ